MGYIGAAPQFGNMAKQVLTPDSSTIVFTMDYSAASNSNVLVSYGGVIQEPGVAYTVVGDQITFTFTPTTDILLYLVFLGIRLDLPTPADESVTEAKLDAAVGAPILIASATASASATVDLEGMDSTYDTYKLVISGARPATDQVEAWLRVKDTTYQSDATDYAWHSSGGHDISAISFGDVSDAQIKVSSTNTTDKPGNATTESFNAVIYIYVPADTGFHTCINGHITYLATDGTAQGITDLNFSGQYKAAAAITGIRFMFASGNVAEGSFKLYGMR